MIRFFIPYNDTGPAALYIKGHRMLILATEECDLVCGSKLPGWNEIREIEHSADESEFLADLAAAIEGGVIVLPPGERLTSVIDSLEEELPWVH